MTNIINKLLNKKYVVRLEIRNIKVSDEFIDSCIENNIEQLPNNIRPTRIGAYTTRIIDANTELEAENLAKILSISELMDGISQNSSDDPINISLINMRKARFWENLKAPGKGFTFYLFDD